jgi:hypothetical protein
LQKVLILKGDQIFNICSTYKEAIELAKNQEELSIYKVPKNLNAVRILPLRIKNFKKHPWVPLYPVKFFINENDFISENALIDSGADISAINLEMGLALGFQKETHDYKFQVEGIGGVVDYILKEVQISIDETVLKIPVAWLQDKNNNDVIIGREVIFDEFDIEFRQRDENIIFHKKDAHEL